MVGRLTAAPAAGNFNDTAGLATDGVSHGLGVAWDNTPRVATGNDIIVASISVAAYPHSDIIAFRSTSFGAAANTFYLNYNGGTATSGSDGGGRALGAANMFIGKNVRPTYLTGTLSEWYTTNQYLPPSDMNTIGTNIDAFFNGTNPVSWTNVSS